MILSEHFIRIFLRSICFLSSIHFLVWLIYVYVHYVIDERKMNNG